MGGSLKPIQKTMGNIVDPFNLSPKISKSWVGKSIRAINKVVDPLNIMDPVGVLPSSWAAGKTPFTFDKTYGGAAQKWLGINQKSSNFYPMTKGLSSNPQYFQQQQQMLQNMQAQQQSKQAQQQSKLANLRSQAPSYPAATQTTTAQVPVSSSASATAPSTATLAQTKSSDTASASDLPMEFGYKPPMKDLKVATANTFSLPNMSDIKFGGA